MRNLLLAIGSLMLSLAGNGQLSVGPGQSLFLQNGVTFFADSLVFVPGTDLTISNNILTHNYVMVPSIPAGNNSITRVYSLTAPITFTGDLGIVYSDAELAGNTENLLQIAYKNGNTWTTTSTSSVNTTTNLVSSNVTGAGFSTTTATNTGVALPLTYGIFSTALKQQYVLLNWQAFETGNLTSFNIEYSNDGRNWTKAGTVAVTPGQVDFSFTHNDLNFSIRYYRVAGITHSGQETYSRISLVNNGNMTSGLHLLRSGNESLQLYFSGPAPSLVQLYNLSGQLIATQGVKDHQCAFNGLLPGNYIIHYTLNGHRYNKQLQF